MDVRRDRNRATGPTPIYMKHYPARIFGGKEVDVCPEETVAGSWFNSRLCMCVCVCAKEVRNRQPVITLIIIQREKERL